MVRISAWDRYLEEQKIKEKKRLEKEAAEKKRKEAREKYVQQTKLERELSDALDTKLAMIEKRRKETKQRRTLRLAETPPIPKKRPEFILSEEDKAKCIEKTLDQLVDEISGSKLVCPPGKELKKDIDKKELTADLKCFRKRVRRKSPEEIVALYDKLLADDPERLCKEKKE